MLLQKIIRLSSNFASLRVARGLIFCSASSFTHGMQNIFSPNGMYDRQRLEKSKDGVQGIPLVMLKKVSGLERAHG